MRRFRGPRALGRTPLGRHAQRQQAHQHPRHPPAAPHHPASASRRSANPSRSPTSSPCRPTASTGCSATRSGRTGSRQSRRRRPRRRLRQVRSRGDLRGDQPDRGLPGDHVAVVPRSRFYEPRSTRSRSARSATSPTRRPLFVTAEFMNNTTGEIKSQTVFMGDFPLMTDKGTFVINGTERVVVSQLVRSPGVYFDKSRRQDLRQGRLRLQDHPVPRRLARVRDRQARPGRRPRRPQAQAVGHGPAQGPRLGRRQDPRGVRRVRVDPRHPREGPHRRPQDEALLDIYRKLRPGEPPTREAAQTLLDNLYFNPKRYDLAKVGRYKVNKKLGVDLPLRLERPHRSTTSSRRSGSS